jgi:hypothetical protein
LKMVARKVLSEEMTLELRSEWQEEILSEDLDDKGPRKRK